MVEVATIGVMRRLRRGDATAIGELFVQPDIDY